jgi:hypothetical protein
MFVYFTSYMIQHPKLIGNKQFNQNATTCNDELGFDIVKNVSTNWNIHSNQVNIFKLWQSKLFQVYFDLQYLSVEIKSGMLHFRDINRKIGKRSNDKLSKKLDFNNIWIIRCSVRLSSGITFCKPSKDL